VAVLDRLVSLASSVSDSLSLVSQSDSSKAQKIPCVVLRLRSDVQDRWQQAPAVKMPYNVDHFAAAQK
jgi:hypothetical protein